MRHLLTLILLGLLATGALADYTGIVSETHTFASGAVAVNMDGEFPNQKMMLYVSKGHLKDVGPLPPVGAKVTCTGAVTEYRGHPEIKVISAKQWSWLAK